MSLIIARVIDGDIFLHSDTRVSIVHDKSYSEKQPPLAGVLKSVIIIPEICICFANTIEFAHLALEKIFDEEIFCLEEIKSLLLSIHIENNQETDFLIASTEGAKSNLILIKDGVISEGLTNAWLGSKDAFDYFQERFHSFPSSREKVFGDELRQKISFVFEDTIDSSDERTSSVGDFHISIRSQSGKFYYEMKIKSFTGPMTIKTKKDEWVPIPFGNAQNGSYGECYLISEDEDKPAVGIHFMHGGFGILFYPKYSRNIIFVNDVYWGDEFTEKVEGLYGVKVVGLVYVPSPETRKLRELKEEGAELIKCGENERAREVLTEALSIKDDPIALSDRGIALYNLKKFDEALNDLDSATSDGFKNPITFLVKGLCYLEIGKEKDDVEFIKLAYKNFRASLDLDEKSQAKKFIDQFNEDWVKQNFPSI